MSNKKDDLDEKYGKVFDIRTQTINEKELTIEIRGKRTGFQYSFTACCDIGSIQLSEDYNPDCCVLTATESSVEQAYESLNNTLIKQQLVRWERVICMDLSTSIQWSNSAVIIIGYNIYDISKDGPKQYRKVSINEDGSVVLFDPHYGDVLAQKNIDGNPAIISYLPYSDENLNKVKEIIFAINVIKTRINNLMKVGIHTLYDTIVTSGFASIKSIADTE